MVILQDSFKTDGYIARFLRDGWLSCKILARRMAILQYPARFWKKILQDDVSSCKTLLESCKILQNNHSDPTRVYNRIRKYVLGIFVSDVYALIYATPPPEKKLLFIPILALRVHCNLFARVQHLVIQRYLKFDGAYPYFFGD